MTEILLKVVLNPDQTNRYNINIDIWIIFFFSFKGKKKKVKGTKMALTDFLADGSSPAVGTPGKIDWATEMDNNDLGDGN